MNKKDMLAENPGNGFIELLYRKDGVYLVVHPPGDKGVKVSLDDVMERIARKRIFGFNREAVAMAVYKSERVPVKIAEPQDEVKIDAEVTVKVTPDKMKAYISISPPDGGKLPDRDEILKVLEKHGVIYGINMSLVEDLARFPVFNQEICIAEGTPAVRGTDGSIEYHFKIKKDTRPVILEDGSVDYRDLGLIENVHKGQRLCTVIPPTKGIKGRRITGDEIPAIDGKQVILPRGKNVEISEDGQGLVAAIDGQVELVDGKINVFPTYEVPGDVGIGTGNINFVGSVIVRGNVLSGFTVEAGGNVEVWGVVEGAVIKAGGNIILKRGIQGLGKGLLISGGDIVAKYIEHSNVEAKNDVKAEAIMHSNVKCGNRLELGGRKGLLVGGTCKVGREIVAKVIGSQMTTSTELEVGVDPIVRERYKEAREEMLKIEEDLRKADQAIFLLKKLEAAGAITQEKKELLAKTIRTRLHYLVRKEELKKEIEVAEEMLQHETHAKVRALSFIYPGTKVSIGNSVMYVKEPLQHCTLYRDGVDIRIGSFER